MKLKKIYLFCLLFTAFVLASCSSQKLAGDLTLEQRMQEAIELFNKRKYLDARTQFRVITLSHGGSQLADKAQFYLAECHYALKEYILSSAEYERLLKVYPNSEFRDDAKYKLGMSYFQLSPKYSLDQEYTLKAIEHFQEFLEEHHSSEYTPEVEKKLSEARGKLAHKLFAAADQYRKMGELSAAIIYYQMVLDKYYDSDYAADAQYWVGECYRKQKHYDLAAVEFEKFMQKFSGHSYTSRVQSYLAEMPKTAE